MMGQPLGSWRPHARGEQALWKAADVRLIDYSMSALWDFFAQSEEAAR